MIQLYACSSNAGKLQDFQLVVGEAGFVGIILLPLPGLKEIAPPEETGATFEQNASLKALYYSQFTKEIVLADDSGLEVDALAGEPGVHSARYAGLHATDAQNSKLLLENLGGVDNRRAGFVCSIALAQQSRILTVVRAAVRGEILHASKGERGFGYDPLFFYPPLNSTFGEMADSVKFAVSHRGSAVREIISWIRFSGILSN